VHLCQIGVEGFNRSARVARLMSYVTPETRVKRLRRGARLLNRWRSPPYKAETYATLPAIPDQRRTGEGGAYPRHGAISAELGGTANGSSSWLP